MEAVGSLRHPLSSPRPCTLDSPNMWGGGCCFILQKQFRVSGTCPWQALGPGQWFRKCIRLYLGTNELEEEKAVNWVPVWAPASVISTCYCPHVPWASPWGRFWFTEHSRDRAPLLGPTRQRGRALICVFRSFSGRLQSL